MSRVNSHVRFALNLPAYLQERGQVVRGALGNAARKTQSRVRQTYDNQLTRRTGELDRSVSVSDVEVRHELYVIFVYSNLDYAWFHEWGTRSPIRPIRARALSWVSPSGRRVFARQVRGVRATHAFRNAGRQLKLRDFT